MPHLARREVRGILLISVSTVVLYLGMVLAELALQQNASFSSAALAAPSTVAVELGLYFATTLGQLGVYVLVVARYARGPRETDFRPFLLATPVVVMLGLMLVPPLLSIDVLSYLAHGATGLLPTGGDAYTVAPVTVLRLPIGQALVGLGWNPPPAPSPYGPLWTVIEGVVVRIGSDPMVGVYVYKLLAMAAVLGSGWLIWQILDVVRPQDRMLGTALYFWNPVILVELVGEGHNDAVLAFFALLSIYATVRLWAARGIVAATLGGLIKYLPLLTVLPEIVYLWRTRKAPDLVFRDITLGAVISFGIAGGLYALFWGPGVLAGVVHSANGGPWPSWPTIPGVLYWAIAAVSPGADPAPVKAILIEGWFAIFVLVQSVRVKDARDLVRAAANIAVVYALVVSPVYWPWYAVLPITLLVLSPTWSSAAVIIALTIGARITAPLALLPSAFDPAGSPWEWLTLASILIAILIFVIARTGLLGRYANWHRSAHVPGPDALTG